MHMGLRLETRSSVCSEQKYEMASEAAQRFEDHDKPELENVEIQLLTEGIFKHYGFDFRDYSLPSMRRRIWKRIYAEGLSTVSGLIEKVLHDPGCMERLLLDLSINTTAMFRDPTFYLTFRHKVVPLLRTYPFIRIWHAGCSTGEEVYSMAILLQEEGLYDRCRIYATDINESVLQKAKTGIFPLSTMQENTSNYIAGVDMGRFPTTTRRATTTRSSVLRSATTSSLRSTTSSPTHPSITST
jgi:chemotaxis protein methyltransferase CheR